MGSRITAGQIKRNIVLSITAQVVSLCVSIIMNLIVPRFIDIEQFAKWQVFTLYFSYVGILHFGLLDGIMLRYSQYDVDELDKEVMRSQFKTLLVISILLCLLGLGVAASLDNRVSKEILVLLSIGVILQNMYTYNSYLFQITNRISKYALLIISNRVFDGALVLLFLFLGVNEFEWYCVAAIAALVFGIVISSFMNKGMYFGHSLALNDAVNETIANLKAGILLLIANWASMLILSGAKMVVQWRWDLITFGKVSFAFSLVSLFLTVVTAVSIVVFPSMKRLDEERLQSIYHNARNTLTPLLFAMLCLYFPACKLIEWWLPAYSESVVYLGIMFPLIIYTSLVSLLTNNYLKAYRQEKMMLYINLITLFVAFSGFVIFAYLLDNIKLLLIWSFASVMLRLFLSEKALGSQFLLCREGGFISETILTVIFVLVTIHSNLFFGFVFYIVAFIIYFMVGLRQGFVNPIRTKNDY